MFRPQQRYHKPSNRGSTRRTHSAVIWRRPQGRCCCLDLSSRAGHLCKMYLFETAKGHNRPRAIPKIMKWVPIVLCSCGKEWGLYNFCVCSHEWPYLEGVKIRTFQLYSLQK